MTDNKDKIVLTPKRFRIHKYNSLAENNMAVAIPGDAVLAGFTLGRKVLVSVDLSKREIRINLAT